MTDRKIISIYVRKGASDDERRISFPRPEGVPLSAFLNCRLAIDGNQVLAIVGPFTDEETGQRVYAGPFGVTGRTFTEALAETEQCLSDLLYEHGYNTNFV